MNAGFLLIPLLLIRYALLALLSREAFRRAAHFAPMAGRERWAYWVYQATSLGAIVYVFFLAVRADSIWFYIGLGAYAAGSALLAASVVSYAKPKGSGINTGGVYGFSRNPMYIAYFLYFLGCAGMAGSPVLLAAALVNQMSAHFIILSEERWCLYKFGDEYREYRDKVRRYI